MNYTCPVCGYNELELPPADFTICPSCGTEFGYHDATASLEELRQRWIGRGAPWTSQAASVRLESVGATRAGNQPGARARLHPITDHDNGGRHRPPSHVTPGTPLFGTGRRFQLPSVITFRLKDMRPTQVNHYLNEVLDHFATELQSGALISVGENGIRVRRLPVID